MTLALLGIEFSPIATHIATFLVGILVGGAGKYCGDLFTDKRKKQESDASRKQKWEDVQKKMPELLAEMKTDWSKPNSGLIRKFFIIHEGQEMAVTGGFYYYYEVHENLEHKATILENHGFVQLVELDGVIKGYSVTEEFVEFVLK